MVADCKSAALRSYGGSNPPLCTSIVVFRADVAQLVEHSLGKRCGSGSVAATKKEDVTR
jgi:hypothetical protein